MPEAVLIKGGGLAACCCASLLSRAGFRVYVDLPARAASPMLMLSQQTQRLLMDVFEAPNLFAGAVEISERAVLWGQNAEPIALPHSGLVISESVLLSRLWGNVKVETGDGDDFPGWRVISSHVDLPAISQQHAFGSRMASTNTVPLCTTVSRHTCWVESVRSGWLFLIPHDVSTGSLISVGANPQTLLGESRLISSVINDVGTCSGSFPAYPRVAMPICGQGWIGCGTAVLAFDPIAGEGAGHALREGILAAAVIGGVGKVGEQKDLLAHYSNRMLNGFLRHLTDCCRFYSAVPEPWWQSELECMKIGNRWVREELASNPAEMFRLLGFVLERIA